MESAKAAAEEATGAAGGRAATAASVTARAFGAGMPCRERSPDLFFNLFFERLLDQHETWNSLDLQ